MKVFPVFSFIDEVIERQDPRYDRTIQIVDVPSRSYMLGYRWFMKREAFEKSEHLKSDCFTIRLDLIVIEEERQH